MPRRHHHCGTPGRPMLDRLPVDPKSQRIAERASTFGGRHSSPEVAKQIKQLRDLLTAGPVTLWSVCVALHVNEHRSRWLLRKLRLAGEIQPLPAKRWVLANRQGIA